MNTPLLDSLLLLVQGWKKIFPQQRTYTRAIRLALAHILTPGSRTISRLISSCGLEQVDWSADYRVFSRSQWSHRRLFQPLITGVLDYFAFQDHITLAGDFTHLPKTGRHIPNVHCMRDPMSPAFHVNLIYGLRFVQYTVLVPLYRFGDGASSPRSIPVAFDEIPAPEKPGKRASAEEVAEYKKLRRSRNSSKLALTSVVEMRRHFDEAGAGEKDLLLALDGSFCNQVFFGTLPDRVELICRTRKDARLCFGAPKGSRSFYDSKTFTPEEVRQDETICWQTCSIFHGGTWREVRYKEIPELYWRKGAKRRKVRLLVLAATAYRITKKARLYYRQPAYLLTTDLKRPVEVLVQAYFDRWQIEVNHREEKSNFGVGEAQVRNLHSVPRQPAFSVAVYAMMLLAALKTYGDKRTHEYLPLPKWRRKARRPSCLDIVSQLRREMEPSGDKLLQFRTKTAVVAAATLRAAA
jgi:hypothetical protein